MRLFSMAITNDAAEEGDVCAGANRQKRSATADVRGEALVHGDYFLPFSACALASMWPLDIRRDDSRQDYRP